MFFRHAAAGVGGYFLLPQLATESVARAAVTPRGGIKQVVFAMMAGAPSHTDTFDLKEGPWTPKSFEPTSYGPQMRIPRGIMPGIADRLENVAFLRSVQAWAVVHGLANQWIQIARSPIPSSSRSAPHIGSVVAREFAQRSVRSALPAFFALNANGGGPGAGFLPVDTGPIYLQPSGGGLSPETPYMDREAFARRRDLLMKLESGQQFEGAAADAAVFKSNGRALLFDDGVDRLFRFSEEDGSRFGSSTFGNACLIARNLIKAEMGVRFIEITFPGWDMHAAIYQTLPLLTRQFDDGIASLMTDLKSAGKLDETLIVAMGEFGRTVGALNGGSGRDHYAIQSAMVAGGGIRGNRAIGETDERGGATKENGWSADRNIRAEDIGATIYSALGIDWTTVLRTDTGARFEYVPISEERPYQPVAELWR